MKHKKALAFLLLFCILSAAGGALFASRLRFTGYTALPLQESGRELANPYIGWYQIYGYLLEDSAALDLSGIQTMEYGPGLVLLQFNLQNYTDTPVSEAGLGQLDEILSAWRSTGRQLIVRFLYDWDGDVSGKEPATLSQVQEHMTQTASVLNRYADSIYLLQGVYLGAWGEMHSSPLLDEENMVALAAHLAQVVDERIYLAVRTPQQWRTIAASELPLSESQAFSGSLPARLGLYNDGMLGSVTDVGTYADPAAEVSQVPYGKRDRQQEIAFQSELCTFVPNGGEVIIDNPCNDLPQALKDLAATHISYLNNMYDDTVLSKWKATAYRGADPYDGLSGYDYIARHLGYRYVLRSSACQLPSPWEEMISCSITLENVGFSNSYRPFDVSLFLVNTPPAPDQGTATDGGKVYHIPVSTDTRLWNPGRQILLGIPLHSHDYPPGTYTLYLRIADPVSGFPIYLANEEEYTEYGYAFGTLTIRKFAQ